MTTFTLQDLTPAQQEAVKQHEAMLSAYSILNTRSISNLPTTPEEDEAMQALSEKQFVEYGMNNPISASAIEYATQPSGENPHNIGDIINTICAQLQLLATVIKQQPNTTPPEGANLQDCVEQVLQQAVWFEKMVEEQVESRVESEVESYFQHGFDPSNYFDFGDAVCNEVSDQIDDVVRERLDEVVQEQLEEVVAERLKSIRVVFD